MEAKKEARGFSFYRITKDTGYAFSMGAIGGYGLHFVQGVRNSPNGHRFVGGMQAGRLNAPRIGGQFGVFGALFSVVESSMISIRKKEDRWNPIIAGAATGGILSIRKGLVAASTSALMGGVLLALLGGSA